MPHRVYIRQSNDLMQGQEAVSVASPGATTRTSMPSSAALASQPASPCYPTSAPGGWGKVRTGGGKSESRWQSDGGTHTTLRTVTAGGLVPHPRSTSHPSHVRLCCPVLPHDACRPHHACTPLPLQLYHWQLLCTAGQSHLQRVREEE